MSDLTSIDAHEAQCADNKRFPRRRRLFVRRTAEGERSWRILRWTVLIEAVAVFAVIVFTIVWVTPLGGWIATSVHGDQTLRGDIVPANRTYPPLSAIRGLQPPMPTPQALRGTADLLLGTSAEPPSAVLMHAVLEGFSRHAVSANERIDVVVWGKDAARFARSLRLPPGIYVHVATTLAASHAARHAMGLAAGDCYGMTFGRSGVWRSSFAPGQMLNADLVHDLNVLAGN